MSDVSKKTVRDVNISIFDDNGITDEMLSNQLEDDCKRILTSWREFKHLVKVTEENVRKTARGVVSVGFKTRNGLRTIAVVANDLLRQTNDIEKLYRYVKFRKEKVLADDVITLPIPK